MGSGLGEPLGSPPSCKQPVPWGLNEPKKGFSMVHTPQEGF